MTFDDLALRLKQRIQLFEGKPYPAIHLLGIEYAEELEGHSLSALAEAAGRTKAYGTELSKGRRIAPFVALRDE